MLDTAIEVKAKLKADDQSFKPFAGECGAAACGACRWRSRVRCMPAEGIFWVPGSPCPVPTIKPPYNDQPLSAFMVDPPCRQVAGHDFHQALDAHPCVV